MILLIRVLLPTLTEVVGVWFSLVCLSFFSHDVSKFDAARITKRDEFWIPVYFGVRRSRSPVTKNIAGVGLCSLV